MTSANRDVLQALSDERKAQHQDEFSASHEQVAVEPHPRATPPSPAITGEPAGAPPSEIQEMPDRPRQGKQAPAAKAAKKDSEEDSTES